MPAIWIPAPEFVLMEHRRADLAYAVSPNTKRAFSRRSIWNGLMHFVFIPMHTFGIFTRRTPSLGTSWVTTVCPCAWAVAIK